MGRVSLTPRRRHYLHYAKRHILTSRGCVCYRDRRWCCWPLWWRDCGVGEARCAKLGCASLVALIETFGLLQSLAGLRGETGLPLQAAFYAK